MSTPTLLFLTSSPPTPQVPLPQLLLQPFSTEATWNPTGALHILTFKYCRLEKILPQPG